MMCYYAKVNLKHAFKTSSKYIFALPKEKVEFLLRLLLQAHPNSCELLKLDSSKGTSFSTSFGSIAIRISSMFVAGNCSSISNIAKEHFLTTNQSPYTSPMSYSIGNLTDKW